MNWQEFKDIEFNKPYFKDLMKFIDEEYKQYVCYPSKEDIFNFFSCPEEEIKVVILGQDPYHGPDQAHGLAFSVKENIKLPPSLRNILKELKDDLNIERTSGDFSSWAKQGVLLLNTTLTVRKSKPLSHKGKGWETFTDNLIKYLNKKDGLVFILWGAHAESKEKLITNKTISVIKSPHPSPLSSYRGFFGSKPFSKANNKLIIKGRTPIDWR